MPSTLIRNVFNRGKYSNYLIGGNVCNAFALGELGSSDDFFLVGAEPDGESNYPLLTGNILDSEGNILFRLVKNMLVINPGHCSKILGDHVGYEIHDGNGHLIFKVQTKFECLPGDVVESFVTTIAAKFYNKVGQLVFYASLGESEERIESQVKSAFGFAEGFHLVQRMSDDEITVARLMLASGGAIHRLITGQVTGQDISLDGTACLNADISNCRVQVSTGEFALIGNNIRNCKFDFTGAAENIRELVVWLMQSTG
jgi:hypothetical protein